MCRGHVQRVVIWIMGVYQQSVWCQRLKRCVRGCRVVWHHRKSCCFGSTWPCFAEISSKKTHNALHNHSKQRYLDALCQKGFLFPVVKLNCAYLHSSINTALKHNLWLIEFCIGISTLLYLLLEINIVLLYHLYQLMQVHFKINIIYIM